MTIHGGRAPNFTRVRETVTALSAELVAHMRKEERVLFPAIDAIEAGTQAMLPISAPIAIMEDEHDHAGALLAELRALTEGYEPPDWAAPPCAPFITAWRSLNRRCICMCTWRTTSSSRARCIWRCGEWRVPMARIPLRPPHPERVCWGCEKYCPSDDLACGNGTIRAAHPCELFGDDWLEWSLKGQPEAKKRHS